MAAILMYHHIAPPPPGDKHRGLFVAPDRFAAQMEYLKKSGFHVVTLDAVRDDLLGIKRLPRRSVAITFDDGTADNHSAALPVLQRHEFPATVFLVTGKLGGAREKPGWPDEAIRYLNHKEIADMARCGIEFGSHTVTHPRLATLDPRSCERELRESKQTIENLLGGSIGWLCYPFGSFSNDVVETAKQVGYIGATSTIRDNRPSREQLFFLPRVMVMPEVTDRHFAYYLSPMYHRIHWFKNRRRWAKYMRPSPNG